MNATDHTTSQVCKHCNTVKAGRFCASCGKEHVPNRLTHTYVFAELISVLNFEKGFFYTLKNLSIRPGPHICEYLHTDRTKLVKPIIWVVFCSLIFMFFRQILTFEDGYINFATEEPSVANDIFSWVADNYGYANLLVGGFTAIWLKLFFRRYRYSFFETLVMICFVMGTTMIFFVVFALFEKLTHLPIIETGAILTTIYVIWAISQFYQSKRWLNYPLALVAYMLGFVTFTLFVLALGSSIEMLQAT